MQTFKKSFLLFVLLSPLIFCAQQFTAEQLHKKDSLTAKLKADSTHIFRPQKFRPYFNLDQRNSFIRSAPVNVNGIQLGTQIHDRHVVGLGGYLITQTSRQKAKTKSEKNIEVNRTLDIRYATAFYQYVAIDKRYFELDIQAELGVGNFDLNFYDTKTNHLLLNRKGSFWVSGLGPIIAIKPTRWIGFMGMAGYRFTFGNSTNLNFNGLYYGYGLWLDVRQIIRDTRYYLNKKPKYKREVSNLLK